VSIREQSKRVYTGMGRGIDHGGKMLYSVEHLRKAEKPTIGFEPTTY
jgi:hypothetical protein